LSRKGEWTYVNIFTKARQAQRPKEAATPLPSGWRLERSQSRKGEWAYVNVFTKARQSEIPTKAALQTKEETVEEKEKESDVVGKEEEKKIKAEKEEKVQKEKEHKEKEMEMEIEANESLPEGWKAVPSLSRPGQVSYVNIYTNGKQQTRPVAPAPQATAARLTNESRAAFDPLNHKMATPSIPEDEEAEEAEEAEDLVNTMSDGALVSCFAGLAQTHADSVTTTHGLLTQARRRFNTATTGVPHPDENRRVLAYSASTKQRDATNDQDWINSLEGSEDVISVENHLLSMLSSGTHPLGRSLRMFTDAILSALDRVKQQSSRPHEHLEDLGSEVRDYVALLLASIYHVFPPLGASEVLSQATEVAVEMVLFLRLYRPVMQLVEIKFKEQDDICDSQFSQFGGLDSKPLQFNVRAKHCLDFETYSPAVSLMCGFSGLQSPLEKVRRIKEACGRLSTTISAVDGNPIGADDLLPLFSYIAACAQVPKFYSQVQFMELFTGEEANCGEAGYYLAMTQSTVSYIMQMNGEEITTT